MPPIIVNKTTVTKSEAPDLLLNEEDGAFSFEYPHWCCI